jgi:magnesium chelatase family protein
MRGAFAMACGTAWGGSQSPRTRELYLPAGSATEAALVPGVDVYGADDLPSLCAHLAGEVDGKLSPVSAPERPAAEPAAQPDMAEVIGQHGARRALEVAAAGGHHVLTCGQLNPTCNRVSLASVC